MAAFDLKVWNKHIIIESNSSLLLIDTGSPYSFQKDGIIKIGEQNFNVPKGLMGIDSHYLTEKVGIHISGLIGMDLLKHFSVWFNSPQFGNVILFCEKDDITGQPLSDSMNFMGCPTVKLGVNHQEGSFLFDSGAPVSYISSRFIQDVSPCGKTYDFSPLIQKEQYEVDLFYLKSNLNQYGFNIQFAQMPAELEMMLSKCRIDGIIGFDLIDHFRLIISQGVLYLPPQGI